MTASRAGIAPGAELRVLAVTNHYPTETLPGDAPCIRDQVRVLRELGVDVDVLYLDRSRRRASYLAMAWRLFRLTFERRRYDLVHAYYGYAGLLARLQLRVPVVVTFRGSDLLSRRNRRIGPVVARSARAVIVMSEEMRRASGRADAHVIPFGVDPALFRPSASAQARAELGLALDRRLVLFPWNPARPEKRFDLVTEAVAKLQAERGDVELITLWEAPPETVVKYMNACDALVLASDREGAPMTVREALACNLPIVAVDVGDVRAVIGDVTGCHLCHQDARDLAEKLGRVLDAGRRLDAAHLARGLDAQAASRRVLEVYRGVLD